MTVIITIFVPAMIHPFNNSILELFEIQTIKQKRYFLQSLQPGVASS